MRLGIVGAEHAKFTTKGVDECTELIALHVNQPEVDTVVSGACHLGGVDTWAANLGHSFNKKVIEHKPRVHEWTAGYKPRNILIARDSDVVLCFTVARLSNSFRGPRFEYCYHCQTDKHVKSGGCWTVKWARALGKKTGVIVIKNEE